jgi:zinc D-Ala-D-Ala carboxypeptidase
MPAPHVIPMQLTENFTLEEMCASQAAARRGLDNTPGAAELANLKRVAAVMEMVRTILGGPIHVDSGYRSPLVNASVGGVSTSAHCRGLACDFICPALGTPTDVALAILRSDIDYDQLILEYGWVHLALADEGLPDRHETLTKRSPESAYEIGISS